MNREDFIRMAQECWPSDRRMWSVDADLPRLERFAAIVAAAKEQEMMERIRHIIVQSEERGAAAEREACAKLVEPDEEHRRDANWGYLGGKEGVELLDNVATAIRARGTK